MSTGFAFKQSLHLCSVSNLRIFFVFQRQPFELLKLAFRYCPTQAFPPPRRESVLIAGGPLPGFAAILGIILASSTTSTCYKHLAKKVAKHEKKVTLAMSKQNTVSELVSKVIEKFIIGSFSSSSDNLVPRVLLLLGPRGHGGRVEEGPWERGWSSDRSKHHSMKDDLRKHVTENNG